MARNVEHLPSGLPEPRDDGAADHLMGLKLPDVLLQSTAGSRVRLSEIGDAVIFCYPRTGRPDAEPLGGEEVWNAIPGARGCTPQACAYRDHYGQNAMSGFDVYGISTQSSEYQREAVARLGLPFHLLSDEHLAAAETLRLPTFTVGGVALLKRLTLICRSSRIVHVRYPVFPPNEDAGAALAWLRARAEVAGSSPS